MLKVMVLTSVEPDCSLHLHTKSGWVKVVTLHGLQFAFFQQHLKKKKERGGITEKSQTRAGENIREWETFQTHLAYLDKEKMES